MKRIFFTLVICLSFQTCMLAAEQSFSDKITKSVTSFIDNIVDQVKMQLGYSDSKQGTLEMPTIPQPKNNPLDLKVYQKRLMSLYSGSRKYFELPIDKKKKQSLGFIIEIYQVTQLRQPTRREINDWLNGLLQGGSREGVYRGIVYSQDYRSLEAQQLFTTESALEFSVKYLKNYLEKKASSDLLSKLDIYSLKKIIVKTTLKTLESMATDPQSLMTWYAIFSADLASKYPKIWKYKLRANQNEQAHLQWAQQAAYQQIITEVIVKLHKTFNHLGKLSL